MPDLSPESRARMEKARGERFSRIGNAPRSVLSAYVAGWATAHVEAEDLISRLLDEGEPASHKNAPRTDAEWGSRNGDGIPDCPWCAAREFVSSTENEEEQK